MAYQSTVKMLDMYKEQQPVTSFLSSFFQSPLRNFHNSEEVEIHIQRGDEDIAIAITDLSTGYNMNQNDLYTVKKFKPPLFKEAFPINAYDMIKNQPGMNFYEDPDFQANAMSQFVDGMIKCENLIRRTTDLQAAQVLTTGIVTLVNAAGTAVYTIDYKPKASHFPTAGTAWTGVNPTIRSDLSSLADEVRDDGKIDPDIFIFGIGSLNAALNDSTFVDLFDNRRINVGEITALQDRGNGAKYRGTIDLDNYKFEVWTYNGRYKHPQTGVMTKYIPDDKVVCLSSQGRLDLTWGNVPIIVPPDQRILRFLPPRVRRTGAGGADMITNAWVTPDGEHLFGGVSARPLAIPTAIDTFGCLDTGI